MPAVSPPELRATRDLIRFPVIESFCFIQSGVRFEASSWALTAGRQQVRTK